MLQRLLAGTILFAALMACTRSAQAPKPQEMTSQLSTESATTSAAEGRADEKTDEAKTENQKKKIGNASTAYPSVGTFARPSENAPADPSAPAAVHKTTK